MTDTVISEASLNDFLAHHGVKGMKWGVRKQDDVGYRATVGPQVDANIHPSTKQAAQTVAALFGERYGLNITDVVTLGPDHPEYKNGTYGYVENTPGTPGGKIYVRADDIRPALKQAEKGNWFAKGTGTTEAFLTHEAGHVIFHADQKVTQGLFGPKIRGGQVKARDAALNAAVKEARKEGIFPGDFHVVVSGYSHAAANREEMEAELFSQYHWGTNPPKFVQVWGETLHQELGIDSTPFREVARG